MIARNYNYVGGSGHLSCLVTEGGESPEIKHHIAWIDLSDPSAAAIVVFIHWGGNRP